MTSSDTLTKLRSLHLAVETLAIIETLDLDENTKIQLTKQVLETVGVTQLHISSKTAVSRQKGSQDLIIDTLKELGGSGTRAVIAKASGLKSNNVSALLSKLVKIGAVEKIPTPNFQQQNRTGRGLNPEYTYKLLEK